MIGPTRALASGTVRPSSTISTTLTHPGASEREALEHRVSIALAWISGPGIALSVELAWMSLRLVAVAPITTILLVKKFFGSFLPVLVPL